MPARVLVVALDGADLRVLRPWMEAGELPELAALARDGAHGLLRSVVPPLTPPAWASFATGKHPGRHGVFGFAERGARNEELRPVNAGHIRSALLWDYLREFGVRAAVVGVPMTYPTPPVDGALVSSFMTPQGRRDFTYPRALLDEIEARFGLYPLYLDVPLFCANSSARNVRRFLDGLTHEADVKFRVTRWLAERCDARFVMLHLWGTDRIQHELWNLLDETHPLHDRRLAARVRGPILAYWRGLDERIGALRRALGDDVVTLVLSDHGFGPIHSVIDLNWWLASEGFIRFRRGPLTRLRLAAWRLGLTSSLLALLRVTFEGMVSLGGNAISPMDRLRRALRRSRRLVLSFRDVDWSRTTAFAPPGLSIGSLMVNVRGREPQGHVAPGAERDAVQARLVERLGALARRLGDGLERRVYTSEALYGSGVDGAAPDVIFLPLDEGYLPTNLFDFLLNRTVARNRIWPGNHRMDGLFIAHGPPIARGRVLDGARIVDVAPTILHLLGCPVPDDMDGAPLAAALARGFTEQHPVRACEPAAPQAGAEPGYTSEERDRIVERLRQLGYM